MRKKTILFVMIIILTNVYGICAAERKNQNISISIMGDVLLTRGVGKMIEVHGVDYPWKYVSHILNKQDLALINLETSIGMSGKAMIDKEYTFQSSPETLKGVVSAGIDGVAIANNHILDYGQDGFIETLKNLKKMGIKYAGGGRNHEEALKPAIWEVNGMKVGFLAFSRVIPNMNWYASDARAGITSAYDYYLDSVCETIDKTKKEVDFLIVSLHWGKELQSDPDKKDIRAARQLIDSGADLIMGHHPHVLQGIEIYKNKPIVYSLGNFVFNARGKQSNQTMIFNLEVNKKGIAKLNVIPILIKGGQPRIAEGKEKEEIIHMLNQRSKAWNVQILFNGDIEGNIEYIKDETQDSEENKTEENKPCEVDVQGQSKKSAGKIKLLWIKFIDPFVEGVRKVANEVITFL
ncbi:CapA family protein [Clostridiaceae bacterium 35-E11]